MRKLLLVGAALFAVGSIGVAQASHSRTTAKTPVCQKTTSAKRPYQRVVLAGAALKKALASSDTIPPAPKSCPQSLLSAAAGGTEIDVKMLGIAEQPDLGDPDGTGTAVFHLRQGQGRVCFKLDVQNIAQAAAAHIHKGGADTSGPVVVPLANPNAAGSSSGCVSAARVVVNDILVNKSAYYVNVHTADFQNGAVRGQLAPAPGIALFTSAMAGANEKPN